MSFWRTSDARIRWMLVLGLIQVLRMAMDLHVFGAGDLRWLESLSWAVACLAGIPLEEPLAPTLALASEVAHAEWTAVQRRHGGLAGIISMECYA